MLHENGVRPCVTATKRHSGLWGLVSGDACRNPQQSFTDPALTMIYSNDLLLSPRPCIGQRACVLVDVSTIYVNVWIFLQANSQMGTLPTLPELVAKGLPQVEELQLQSRHDLCMISRTACSVMLLILSLQAWFNEILLW